MMSSFDNDTIEKIRVAFQMYDPDSKGSISLFDVAAIFTSMGYPISEHELFGMLNEVESEDTGEEKTPINGEELNTVSFSVFLQLLELYLKQNDEDGENEQDMIGAFVAMGGTEDKKGKIHFDKIRQLCRKFDLTVDCDQLMERMDLDKNGMVDFEEFKGMLNKKYLV